MGRVPRTCCNGLVAPFLFCFIGGFIGYWIERLKMYTWRIQKVKDETEQLNMHTCHVPIHPSNSLTVKGGMIGTLATNWWSISHLNCKICWAMLSHIYKIPFLNLFLPIDHSWQTNSLEIYGFFQQEATRRLRDEPRKLKTNELVQVWNSTVVLLVVL